MPNHASAPQLRLEKLLFATDFSSYSDRARDFSASLVGALSAKMIVAHVIEPIPGVEREDPEFRTWYDKLENDIRAKLEEEVQRLNAAGISARSELLWGSPWEEIIRFAEKSGCQLIVVGSHGIRTPEGRFLLGTTSHKIALASHIPVLIVQGARSGTSIET